MQVDGDLERLPMARVWRRNGLGLAGRVGMVRSERMKEPVERLMRWSEVEMEGVFCS